MLGSLHSMSPDLFEHFREPKINLKYRVTNAKTRLFVRFFLFIYRFTRILYPYKIRKLKQLLILIKYEAILIHINSQLVTLSRVLSLYTSCRPSNIKGRFHFANQFQKINTQNLQRYTLIHNGWIICCKFHRNLQNIDKRVRTLDIFI